MAHITNMAGLATIEQKASLRHTLQISGANKAMGHAENFRIILWASGEQTCFIGSFI